MSDIAVRVFLSDILDDFLSASLAKVDIDIGRRHTLWIEESLKDEAEADGANIRDFKGIGDEASCR